MPLPSVTYDPAPNDPDRQGMPYSEEEFETIEQARDFADRIANEYGAQILQIDPGF